MTKIKHDAHVRQYKKREYIKKWRQENRDKVLEQRKKWEQENRDKRLEYKKKYRQENPEYFKKWEQENRDKRLERHKKYYQENRDKVLESQKKWQQKNWNKVLEYHKRYFANMARPLNLGMWELLYCLQAWSKFIKQDDCQICSNPPKEAHHILYKKYYPELMLNENNGIALCQRCHWEVHGKKLDLIKPLEPILDIRRFCMVSVKN